MSSSTRRVRRLVRTKEIETISDVVNLVCNLGVAGTVRSSARDPLGHSG